MTSLPVTYHNPVHPFTNTYLKGRQVTSKAGNSHLRQGVPQFSVDHQLLDFVDTLQAVKALIQQEGHVIDQNVHKSCEDCERTVSPDAAAARVESNM